VFCFIADETGDLSFLGHTSPPSELSLMNPKSYCLDLDQNPQNAVGRKQNAD
jgi:hypothetical protein